MTLLVLLSCLVYIDLKNCLCKNISYDQIVYNEIEFKTFHLFIFSYIKLYCDKTTLVAKIKPLSKHYYIEV